ncbi:MAG: hypothetical protein LBI27_08955 [Clostridiales bacterium]|jgi:hypothetical protein|nr:hypothetical protein [Clostridiales bacterium]
MNKREQLESLKRENARERQEARDNEWYIRDGEDYTIQMVRDKMARVLADAELTPEERKEKLAKMKEEIDTILDTRDDREHEFIEQELERHNTEHELEQEILQEEKPDNEPSGGDSLNLLFRARSSLTAGAEKMRKEIEEKRIKLNEEEQFSTILISNSERDNIPSFAKPRSRRKRVEPEQTARIDTAVLKQREIGMMYRDSQELQESHLIKLGKKKPPEAPPEEIEGEESAS